MVKPSGSRRHTSTTVRPGPTTITTQNDFSARSGSRVDHHATAASTRDADQHLAVVLRGATASINLPANDLDLARPAESLPTGIRRRRIVVEHDVERRPVGRNGEDPAGPGQFQLQQGAIDDRR